MGSRRNKKRYWQNIGVNQLESTPNIIEQLMGAVDTTTLIATVTSIGLVAVGVKFGEKGITFVKRLIGKV